MKQPIYLKYIKPKYPHESAGTKMVKNIPVFRPEDKISDIKNTLFKKAGEFETLNYVYIVDQNQKLLGVVSLKELLQKPETALAQEIMVKEVVWVKPYTDQERVALLALRHNLKAVPVVDKEEKFLGVVPSDIILEILHSENVEDILKSVGIARYNSFSDKIFQASPTVLTKLRLPWLILGLFGGLLAAKIVGFFEGPLQVHFVLAAFIPLIVYMADAVGTQTETLFIRSLVYRLDLKNYFFKEIKVSLVIAVILGALLVLVSYFWFKEFYIGLILGVSLFLTIVSAFLLGVLVPFIFNKLKKDPAVASGPVGTIIRDILSLVIYFSIASLMLKFL